MISTVQNFDDSTSLERRMLEWASPRTRRSKTQPWTDLRGAQNTFVGISGASTSDSGRREALDELRPLLFGAAWKILDLLFEYALDGLAAPKQKEWRIKAKKAHAAAFSGAIPGLTIPAGLWQRLCLTYGATVEARHALVHKHLEVDAAGAFVNLSASPRTITAAEQDAMQGLALCCSEIVLRQTCRTRDELVLGAYLNALVNLHKAPLLPSSVDSIPAIMVINADQDGARWVFDAQRTYERAKEIYPGRTIFDLEVHLRDSKLPPVRGELERAARDAVKSLDPAVMEPWMVPL